MPIFEYRCSDCQVEFEKIVLRKGENPACPQCESLEVEQLLSSFAVASPDGMPTPSPSESGPCACGAPRRGMCQN